MCADKHLVECAVIAAAAMVSALVYRTLYASVYLFHNTYLLIGSKTQAIDACDNIIAPTARVYTVISDYYISYFIGRRYEYSVFVKFFHFFS